LLVIHQREGGVTLVLRRVDRGGSGWINKQKCGRQQAAEEIESLVFDGTKLVPMFDPPSAEELESLVVDGTKLVPMFERWRQPGGLRAGGDFDNFSFSMDGENSPPGDNDLHTLE
jgi:hypothetical protein